MKGTGDFAGKKMGIEKAADEDETFLLVSNSQRHDFEPDEFIIKYGRF